MAKMTIYIPDALAAEMKRLNKRLEKQSRKMNWSKVAQHRFQAFVNHENKKARGE